MNTLERIFSNKHTTAAAVVYAACELLAIWFPAYKAELDATKQWSVVYGFLLSGQAKEPAEPSVTVSSDNQGMGLNQ